ncbi:hypothetical protein TraAM80_02952 [Trypanosoma rangeli]|uniref:Peroxisomal membrane protein PEX16 n=1 Tax=Trypanosoma rangeli TaxID=5698 RepID=A0A422NR95_TRYRA|nr:uncharacterized protein TraAM80_02952 [Trypanosoma rangeli]RNF08020.1 hypothetical protein TraAM80_02952 [Trypanosoma rangeli]|eukprot:RNF08020.1 hypothetical protein TraAM80_02952 [Trypanosoma rangeli]
MASTLFQQYVSWVRENKENALSLERFTQIAARIATDPRNLVTAELSWTLIKLHSLTNRVILSTAGRRVGRTEQASVILRTVSEVECLLELGLRRFCGHGTAWNVLLVLEAFKCMLNVFVHQQLFIVPWIWPAVRRRLRLILQQFLMLPEHVKQASSAVMEKLDATFCGHVPLAPMQASTPEHADTRLVIPRVAVRRMHHRTAAEAGEKELVAGASEGFPCTAIDLLGLLVDLVLVLRPLLLLFCAKRVFPAGAAGIAALPFPSKAHGDGRDKQKDADYRDELLLVQAAVNDGVSRSLLSSWGVGLSFFGLDAALALLSRYIRRHRVPVVYINNTEACTEAKDGEVSSCGDDAGIPPC